MKTSNFYIASIKFIDQSQLKTIVFDSYETFEKYRDENIEEIQHYSIGLCIGFTADDAAISDVE